jgi:Sec-independent protein translocase protein TatA
MNIFGMGGLELAAILIIMLVVAGPARMIRWAYVIGQYVAKFKGMWADTARLLQKEFDDAGVDVKVSSHQLPSGAMLRAQLDKTLKPATQPMQETFNELKTDLEPTRQPVPTSAGD